MDRPKTAPGMSHRQLGLIRGGNWAVRGTLAALDVTPADLRVAVAAAVRKAG